MTRNARDDWKFFLVSYSTKFLTQELEVGCCEGFSGFKRKLFNSRTNDNPFTCVVFEHCQKMNKNISCNVNVKNFLSQGTIKGLKFEIQRRENFLRWIK